jgi:hypothetical protein
MDSESVSDLTTTVATTELEVPTDIATPDDFRSLRNEAEKPQPEWSVIGYEKVDWSRVKGYEVPSDDYKLDSNIWSTFGWRLYCPRNNRYYWLCKQCHIKKMTLKGTLKEVIYLADKATSGPI